MAEIEHTARRCVSCKHYYVSPCGEDAVRLATCPNWNYLKNRKAVPRVKAKFKKASVLPDHEGPILDRVQPLKRIGMERVKLIPKRKPKAKAKGKKR